MSSSIVILNWNGEEMLRRFLPSVIEHSPEAEVVVADNGSTDGSLKLLAEQFPSVRTIPFDRNYGFAEGYNRAIAQVDSDLCLLLNSDVRVEAGWLKPMLDYMEQHPGIAACQPKIRCEWAPEMLEYAGACGGYIDKLGFPFCRGRILGTIECDKGQYDTIVSVAWATGAALLIRRNIYIEAGGLDARFFAHQEEIDLCWRLRSRGYGIVCIPESVVYHVGGGTLPKESPRKAYLNFRNNLLLLYKNMPKERFCNVMFWRRLLDAAAALHFLVGGHWAACKAVLKAHIDFRRMQKNFKEDRDKNQAATVVPYNEILSPINILWEYYGKRHFTFKSLRVEKNMRISTLLLLMLFTGTVSAQQAWTLQDCLDYALQHNIQVQKNRISEERGEVSLWQDKGALFPSLSFSTNQGLGYRPFTEVINVVQGDQVTSTRSNVTYQGTYGLNANVTLWNGGINHKNIKAQELENRITTLTTEQSELTIQEQIAQLYVQIMYTKEAKRVNELLLSTAQSQYDRGVEMMNQGQMARADVVQLEAQLSSAQYSVVNSETQLANYKRQLKALLELDLNTPFDVSGNIPTDEQVLVLVPSAQEAYAKALETRPEIKSAELSIEAADMQLDIAKRGFYPTIGASASLGSNHSSGSSNGWGEQMKTNLNMSAGINFSVPIFDNRRNMSNVKTAKLQQLSSKLDLQDKKNTLSSTIEQYWLNANNGQQNYIAAKSRVKSQEASYELLNEQFQNGLKNTVDVLQGRDNVISAEQDMLQSKYTALLNIQLLKFYTGEKIEL